VSDRLGGHDDVRAADERLELLAVRRGIEDEALLAPAPNGEAGLVAV
jgi:hypothetical protein